MFPGQQWYCPKCGSAQHGAHRYCSNCGGAAPLRAASGCLGCLGCLGVLVVLGSVMFSVTVASCFSNIGNIATPLGSDAMVKAVSWERVIEIERNELRSREGFKEQIPPDAIEVKRKGRTKTFTYKVREWSLDRTLRANGADHEDIHWPAETVGSKGLERDPNEREARRERYVVTMTYDGDTRMVRFVVPDEKRFRRFALWSRHAITPTSDYVEVDGVRYYHP